MTTVVEPTPANHDDSDNSEKLPRRPSTPSVYLDQIRLDRACQPRAALDKATVEAYAEIMEDGGHDCFPPVTVFCDGTVHWLADGFHRYEAAKKVGLKTIKAEVRGGGRREAILYSVGANAKQGLRGTNEDKRRAVKTILTDDEWSQMSDHKIADACGVSQPFVSRERAKLTDNGYQRTDAPADRAPNEPERSSADVNSSAADPDCSKTAEIRPAAASDTQTQLDCLLVAWDCACSDVRNQFLELIDAVLRKPTVRAEAEATAA